MNTTEKSKIRQPNTFKFRGIIESIRTQKSDTVDDILSRNVHRRSMSQNVLSRSDGFYSQPHTSLDIRNPQQPSTSIDMPDTWSAMPYNLDFCLVDVNYLSPEYMEVIRDFKARMNGIKIIFFKVQRVQSKSLYENFKHHQARLRKKIYNENEMNLWYGVKNEATTNICTFGFTNNYCAGINGHTYGHGVYFSVNTSYAHNYTDVSIDAGVRKMFRARVLVGRTTLGNEKIRTPPTIKSNGEQYDSTCDKEKTLYVVYEDTQSYPEYLITYKSC